jgi:hypothetical protein
VQWLLSPAGSSRTHSWAPHTCPASSCIVVYGMYLNELKLSPI